MEGKRKVGIPVKINDFCTKVGVEVCSMGLEDSQALNLYPQRSGRRYRRGCGILDGEGVSVSD